MAIVNGFYFTKSETKRTVEFLETQGLDEKQIAAIVIYHQSQISAQILLWAAVAAPVAFVSGLFVSSFL